MAMETNVFNGREGNEVMTNHTDCVHDNCELYLKHFKLENRTMKNELNMY